MQNNPSTLYEFQLSASSGTPELLRSIELSGFVDTEAVAWVTEAVTGTILAIAEEDAAAITLCSVSASTTVLTRGDLLGAGRCAYPIFLDGLSGAMAHNKGIEGLTALPTVGGIELHDSGMWNGSIAFYAAREKNPMAIYAVHLSGSYTEPFDAEALWASEIDDIAGLQYMAATAHTVATLLVLSEDSKRVLQVNPSTGEVLSTLEMAGLGSMSQPEGETQCWTARHRLQTTPVQTALALACVQHGPRPCQS